MTKPTHKIDENNHTKFPYFVTEMLKVMQCVLFIELFRLATHGAHQLTYVFNV